jgi:hypothetical protein
MTSWLAFPVNAYLEKRHRNWVLAEEFGDVRFVPSAEVVLVHAERAEHIARALLGGSDVLVLEEVLALPASTAPEPGRLASPLARAHAHEVEPPSVISRSRWRDILGWLGIGAGAAVFAAALALSLDDPALVVALALGMRGGRLILDV